MRYQDLHALVLHVRPYRESSAIVQFLTREQGMLSAVMRGIKRGRRPNRIQAFVCGTLACHGRGTLLTGTRFEPEQTYMLSGNVLSAGFYVLELTTRLLPPQQADTDIFDMTMDVLLHLQSGLDIATVLRPYETRLLQALGYGLDFQCEANTGGPLQPDRDYQHIEDFGFCELPALSVRNTDARNADTYPGAVLLAIAEGDYSSPTTRAAAKRINGKCLAPLLGSRSLVSRQLWEPGAKSVTLPAGTDAASSEPS